MKKTSPAALRAARAYALFLKLYPKEYRRMFGDQMLRTFEDRHNDWSARSGKTGFAYWLAIIGDEVVSVAKEWSVGLSVKRLLPSLVLLGALALVVSSFFWLSGFIVYVKIPAILLLLVGLAVMQTHGREDSSRHAGQPVWRREGLRNGSILGLLWIVLNLLGHPFPNDSWQVSTAKLLDVGILLLGMPILFGLAGFVSGRSSRSFAEGTFAGVLAAVVASAIMMVSLVLIMLLFWATVRDTAFQSAEMIRAWHASGDQSFGHYLWIDNLDGGLAYALISLIFGVLLGTLGGILGASFPGNKLDSQSSAYDPQGGPA